MNGNQNDHPAIRPDKQHAPNRRARRAAGIQAVPPWTDVRDRKPPFGEAVLAWGPLRGFDVLRLRHSGAWETAADGIEIEDEDYVPTGWMPLPERPGE